MKTKKQLKESAITFEQAVGALLKLAIDSNAASMHCIVRAPNGSIVGCVAVASKSDTAPALAAFAETLE